jgi:hypothetical protein
VLNELGKPCCMSEGSTPAAAFLCAHKTGRISVRHDSLNPCWLHVQVRGRRREGSPRTPCREADSGRDIMGLVGVVDPSSMSGGTAHSSSASSSRDSSWVEGSLEHRV